jgi:hypothetical protein
MQFCKSLTWVQQHSGQPLKASCAAEALLGSRGHYAHWEPGLSTSKRGRKHVQTQGAPGALGGLRGDCPGIGVPLHPWWDYSPVLVVPVPCLASFVFGEIAGVECLAPRFYS